MELTRRKLLVGGTAGAAAIGAGVLLSGTGTSEAPETEAMDAERERRLADRFAPDLHFGAGEAWYPTDPRRYASETDDGRTVVTGFDAFDGYARELSESGSPPAPTSFYQGRTYAGTDLGVVQFWFYSAFDQFSVNFHWHDWEVLHVFFDLERDEPVLFVASSHSRKVPNNEFLDPDLDRPAIISEVGSHSSALGVNADRETFQRFPLDGGIADITNSVLDLVDIPAAYGLPRDEGIPLPYAVPELDGTPVYDLPELPNVTREHLVPGELTVDSFDEYDSPPSELPTREDGLHLRPERHPEADAADGTYALVHVGEVSHVEAFTGPQLSFQFAVPGFAEDAVASHLTSVGTPWTQPRFENPAADVTDPIHRDALTERYDLDLTGTLGNVVGAVREATESTQAPGSNGVDTRSPRTEGVARLESDPVAVPTWGGVAAFRDVPAGDHRLTVNAPGVAPYAETFERGDEGGTTAAGADGALVLAPNEDAVKVRAGGGSGDPTVAAVTVEDDFAGAVYAGSPPKDEDGGFGLYVHRAGAFTAEVTDRNGDVGAFRVNPDADQATATVEDLRTGKAALVDFLDTLLSETLVQAVAVAEDGIDAIDGAAAPDDTAERTTEAATDAVEGALSTVEMLTNGTVGGDGVSNDTDGDDLLNETDGDDLLNGTEDDGILNGTDGDDLPNDTDGDELLNGTTDDAVDGTDVADATEAVTTDTSDVVTSVSDAGEDVVRTAEETTAGETTAEGTAESLLNGTESDGGVLDDLNYRGEDGPFREDTPTDGSETETSPGTGTTSTGDGGDGSDGTENDGSDGTEDGGSDGTEDGGSDAGGGPFGGFVDLLGALREATTRAARAAAAAENGDGEEADRQLRELRSALSAVLDAVERTGDDLPGNFGTLVERRVAQADRRIAQALDAET
ncbi:hypothetical protein [Halorarum halobium]|uniref:hypothetical protein n=1 Tax=Halorarum halobium TaxID=3075121 RepID=UPI0028A8B68A|nr:hypothetical protein [Halobaculum sp. XH14]